MKPPVTTKSTTNAGKVIRKFQAKNEAKQAPALRSKSPQSDKYSDKTVLTTTL